MSADSAWHAPLCLTHNRAVSGWLGPLLPVLTGIAISRAATMAVGANEQNIQLGVSQGGFLSGAIAAAFWLSLECDSDHH